MRVQSQDLGIQDKVKQLFFRIALETFYFFQVVFHLNFSFEALLRVIGTSNVGIHTMYNEHFGISVVESMAGGLIMVANDSGGPRMDIIDNEVSGYLASTAEEYSEIIYKIMNKSKVELDSMRKEARRKVRRFSDEMFHESLHNALGDFFGD